MLGKDVQSTLPRSPPTKVYTASHPGHERSTHSVTLPSSELAVWSTDSGGVASDRVCASQHLWSSSVWIQRRAVCLEHVRYIPRYWLKPFDAYCWHTGTAAIKCPLLPDRVKPSFVIFWHPGTLTLRAERQSARMSKNYKWRLNPVWPTQDAL